MGQISRRSLRPIALAVATFALLAVGTPGTLARPSKQDLSQAKARLATLNDRLDVLIEEYDAATLKLHDQELRLADLRAEADRAKKAAATAQTRLGDRASAVYQQGLADRLNVFFSAGSFGDFAARLEFLDRLSQNDTDAAITAKVAGERAREASARLSTALASQRALVSGLASKKADIESSTSEAKGLIDRLEAALRRPVHTGPAALTANQAPLPNLPPASSAAQAAIAAAYSQLGVPYIYAAASPGVGFDCSGLTMWAWGQAGVSLPHSSAAQYAMLPHVAREQLQPGDLLFFYSPIHHVSMYIGSGNMIHAPHTGGVVEIIPVYWEWYVGAGRPGV